MELVVRKMHLHDEKIAPLIRDRQEAMETFWEILRCGASLYSQDDIGQEGPKVYRVAPLKGS